MEKFNEHTELPWSICWGTFNGHKTHFSICGDKHGSAKPVVDCTNDWTGGLGKWESKELEGNAAFIVEACNNYYQLKAKAEMFDEAISFLQEMIDHSDKAWGGNRKPSAERQYQRAVSIVTRAQQLTGSTE